MPTFTDKDPVRFADPLPDAVDVAVIGAGIAGTATAYFLAKAGISVALLEKGRVAGEQSSRNWGFVRQQGRDVGELPLMMEANRIWRGLAAETGEADLAFHECGCYYLIETEAAESKYRDWYEIAKQHQLNTALLTRDELAAHLPEVRGDFRGALVTASHPAAARQSP